jgi:hypothetical protein
MPLRHSRASRLAAEEKKLKDEREHSENRIKMNSQQEIDALADLMIRRERGRPRAGAWSEYTYTEVKRSA